MTRNEAYLLKGGVGVAAAVLSVTLAFLLAVGLSPAPVPSMAVQEAVADDGEESEAVRTAYELQVQIAEAQEEYAAAQEEVARANEAVDANRARIAELEAEIPAQQERSAAAARELYKIQQGGLRITDLLLSSDNLSDFLAGYDYVSYVTDSHLREMNRLLDLKAEIEATEKELDAAQAEASKHADDALAAINELEEAQAEVQRRIEEEARQQAEIAAAAAANAENPRDNDQPDAKPTQGQDDGGLDPDDGQGDQDDQDGGEAVSAPSPVAASSDEEAFIAEWAPRIDAYLAGSPLAGQGTTFAHAAYTYNVDPRWSPAIAFTESGKGQYCFLPHNAWGWGSASWDSWEEAIDDHVAGLSRGYGYTISEAAAKKYCPPNWRHWYERTSAQMEMI